MYEVGDVTPLPSGGFNFSFASGGFQGSRGAATGEDSYIENIFEELDSPGEWFFNESTRVLYLWHNATEGTPPPTDGSLVAVQTKWLLNVTGGLRLSNPASRQHSHLLITETRVSDCTIPSANAKLFIYCV